MIFIEYRPHNRVLFELEYPLLKKYPRNEMKFGLSFLHLTKVNPVHSTSIEHFQFEKCSIDYTFYIFNVEMLTPFEH